MSILTSETLWASDIRSFADTTEFEHGMPICHDALALIRDRSLLEHAELAKQGLAERFRHRTFVSCFSTRHDLRSQWDTYADDQRGFALSFNSLVIGSLAAPQGYMLIPVEYGREAQVARTRRAVGRALHDLEVALPGLPQRETIWTIQARFVLLASEMFFFCTSFKASMYHSEQEWRLIYSAQPGEADALPIYRRRSEEREIDYVIVNLRRRYANDELPSFTAIHIGARTGTNAGELVRGYARDFAKQTKVALQEPL